MVVIWWSLGGIIRQLNAEKEIFDRKVFLLIFFLNKVVPFISSLNVCEHMCTSSQHNKLTPVSLPKNPMAPNVVYAPSTSLG